MSYWNKTKNLLFFSTILISCKSRVESQFLDASASSGSSEEACIGLQGNGIRFPAHIGTYVSLMENNITPAVSLGGSSGSIVAGATMGLLMNSSLSNSRSFQGKSLSKTQQASIVLAAVSKIIDNFLFVPAINELKFGRLEVLPGVFKLVSQLTLGKALAATPEDRIMSIEAVVSQSVLLTDFLQNQDFSDIFSKSTYIERRDYVFDLWKEWANIIETDLNSILIAGSGATLDTGNQAIVADRLFRLFQQDIKQENSQKNVDRGKYLINAVKNFVGTEFGRDLVGKEKVENLKKVKFYLPDPKILWNAYRGFTKSGRFMTMPNGLIVHSTFRLSKLSLNQDSEVNSSEGIGLENLFQGYLTNDSSSATLFQDLVKIRQSMAIENGGFQPYYADSSKSVDRLGYAFPFDKVLLFKNFSENRGQAMNPEKDDSQSDVIFKEGRRGLAHAIAFSAGEPGPFRRLPIFTDASDINFNQIKLKDGSSKSLIPAVSSSLNQTTPSLGLVAFGGWAENVPISTLAMLPSCKKARYYVTGSKDGNGNSFQSGALRAAIRGWSFLANTLQDVGQALGVYNSKGEQLTEQQFAKINGNLEFSRGLASKHYTFEIETDGDELVGRWQESREVNALFIPNNLNFDEPSQAAVDSDTLKSLNGRLSNHRASLMVASYQKMTENLNTMNGSNSNRIQNRINAFGNADGNSPTMDLGASSNYLYRKTSINQIDETLSPVFGVR